MSHAVRRRLLTAAVATCSLALVGAPTAGAKTKPKLSKTDKAQNTAIKKVTKTASSASKTAKKAAKDAKKGIADAKAAAGKADGAQAGVNTVLAGVPQILDGLKKLADGLTQAADGLTKLGNAVAAAEYGTVKLQLGTTDVPGAVFNSSDIPDDGNAATLTGTAIVPVPANTPSTPLRLLAGVRSGEADGTGADNPVAWAGIVSMSVASPVGLPVTGGNAGLPGTVPITSAPNASDATKGAPVYPIPLKAPRSDASPNPFSLPTDKAIDLTDAATLYNISGGGVAPFSVANPGPTDALVTVTFTVRFNDLTASATDVTA
jgi:X-X-X-Leu-X-X-Gly heptad repeat protein